LIIETIVGTLISVLIAFLVYRIHFLRKANKGLAISFIQANLDKDIMETKLKETVSAVANKNLEDKDGFIKFLSESREWAFSYIEEVQGSIKELDAAINSKDSVKLDAAHSKLIGQMPKEDLR
jgi:hypothetical protein